MLPVCTVQQPHSVYLVADDDQYFFVVIIIRFDEKLDNIIKASKNMQLTKQKNKF